MNLSFQEKSILGSMVAMLLVFGNYFATVLGVTSANRHEDKVGNIVGSVVLLIVIEIVYHILIALKWKAEPKDERDLQIEGKAFRNAYMLLASGAFVSMVIVVVRRHLYGPAPWFMLSPYLIVDVILFFMVAAEVTKLITQLFYYRSGI